MVVIIRTSDLSVVRDSHAAKLVERHRGHFSRAPRTVLVVPVVPRTRVVVVVINIPTGRFVLQGITRIASVSASDEHRVVYGKRAEGMLSRTINNSCNIFNSYRVRGGSTAAHRRQCRDRDRSAGAPSKHRADLVNKEREVILYGLA